MRKYTRIEFNPYTNQLSIRIMNVTTGEWEKLADNSELLVYENEEILFSDCADEIIAIIDDGQNSDADGLEIQFVGLDSDYQILKKTVENVNKSSEQRGKLYCKQIGRYEDADIAIDVIRSSYNKIANEFSDYLPGNSRYEEFDSIIGDSIERFNETISDEIPVCIVGNYSVGKSAFINSLIGDEVLPSAENASTAKNAKLISSDRYVIRFEYLINDEYVQIEVHINGHEIIVNCENSQVDASLVTKQLLQVIQKDRNEEVHIIHDILEYFNQSEKDDFLQLVGWNVEIEVPFAKSVLSEMDSKIVFYDTPGSNNATVNQKEHREALFKLMSQQTNALPILLCSKDRATSSDNLNIISALDQNNDNFTNPCCLIVFSKSDKSTIAELQEPVPNGLKSWHGKTTIMYASPVGAIGDRKKNKNVWLDGSYEEHYEAWCERLSSTKRAVSLPDYNIPPCYREKLPDAHKYATSKLYATGIPSVECEIAYYVKNYANYKKCTRGSRDLLEALEVVKRELNIQEEKTIETKKVAEEVKKNQRAELIKQLDEITLTDMSQLSMYLSGKHEGVIDDYCKDLPAIARMIYEEVKTAPEEELEGLFDTKLKEHCQVNLFDKYFLGNDGIESIIIEKIKVEAKEFADELQAFVEKNDSHFSITGKSSLKEALTGKDLAIIHSEEGILANILNLPEKVNFIKFKMLQKVMTLVKKDDKKVLDKWLNSKVSRFEKELKGNGILSRDGLFARQAVVAPLAYYNNQLISWGNSYREYIKTQLDDDNTVLSGMEENIRELESNVNYFSSRLEKLGDVENTLNTVLVSSMME